MKVSKHLCGNAYVIIVPKGICENVLHWKDGEELDYTIDFDRSTDRFILKITRKRKRYMRKKLLLNDKLPKCLE